MKFPLGDILSLLTGKLVSRTGIKGAGALVKYMVGQDLPMILRDTVCGECALELRKQFPHFDDSTEKVDSENWEAWLTAREAFLGPEHEVSPLSEERRAEIAKAIDELPPEAKLITLSERGIER